MDPDACLNRIFDAMGDKDWQEAADACEDLHEWLRKGGFEPKSLHYRSRIHFQEFLCILNEQCLRRAGVEVTNG